MHRWLWRVFIELINTRHLGTSLYALTDLSSLRTLEQPSLLAPESPPDHAPRRASRSTPTPTVDPRTPSPRGRESLLISPGRIDVVAWCVSLVRGDVVSQRIKAGKMARTLHVMDVSLAVIARSPSPVIARRAACFSRVQTKAQTNKLGRRAALHPLVSCSSWGGGIQQLVRHQVRHQRDPTIIYL